MQGARIGSYIVRDKLGEGGMGSVFAAEHSALGRRAAIKVLSAQLSNDPAIVTRFFNEARAASAIRHPGIVEIYDFGHAPDGRAYIIMELLEGETLAARRARCERIDERRAILLTRQIAGALAVAHALGIVHRDLKPDNIFLISDPEVPGGERIKLLDFGIAKLLHERAPASRTQTGFMLGTPAYMAPEQCLGSTTLDARADLYSLGAVLYELVCGRPPFGAEAALEVLVGHVYSEPKRPRQFTPALSKALERLVLRLLRKDPDERLQSAAELVREIDAHWTFAMDGVLTPPDAVATAPTQVLTTPTTLSSAAAVAVRGSTSARMRLVTAGLTAAIASGLAIFASAKLLADQEPARDAAQAPIVQAPPVPQLSAAHAPAAIEPVASAPAEDWVQLYIGSVPAGGISGLSEDTTAKLAGDGERTRPVVLAKKRRAKLTPTALHGDHGVNPFDE